MNWARKNGLYYGDLISEIVAANINAIMEAAEIHEQQEIIQAFEMLHAVVTPDKCAVLNFERSL